MMLRSITGSEAPRAHMTGSQIRAQLDSGVPVPELCASAVGRVVTQVSADAREATQRKARNIISLNDPKVRFMRLLGSVCVQTVALVSP